MSPPDDEAVEAAMEASRLFWKKEERAALIGKLLSFGLALGWPGACLGALWFGGGLGQAQLVWGIFATLNVAYSCFTLRVAIGWPASAKERVEHIERLLPTSGEAPSPDDNRARFVCSSKVAAAQKDLAELVRWVTASLGWTAAGAIIAVISGSQFFNVLFPTFFAGGFAGLGLFVVYQAEQRRAELVKLHREVLVRVQRIGSAPR